jgi:hypoxanthine phosphoribosyltransferase
MKTASDTKSRIRVLFSDGEIAARIRGLGEEIAKSDLHEPLIIALLKGSFIFAADLVRALHHAGMEPEVEFMTLSSYRKGTVSSGQVTVTRTSKAMSRAAMC